MFVACNDDRFLACAWAPHPIPTVAAVSAAEGPKKLMVLRRVGLFTKKGVVTNRHPLFAGSGFIIIPSKVLFPPPGYSTYACSDPSNL